VEYLEAVKDNAVSINLRNQTKNLKVFSIGTDALAVPLKEMEKGERVAVDFTLKVPLQSGLYTVSAAARARDETLDEAEAIVFGIADPQDGSRFQGIVRLPTEIEAFAPQGERQGRSA
jgi:hypothetical protein